MCSLTWSMMQRMSDRRSSQTWGQPTTLDDLFGESELQLGDTQEEVMPLSSVRRTIVWVDTSSDVL